MYCKFLILLTFLLVLSCTTQKTNSFQSEVIINTNDEQIVRDHILVESSQNVETVKYSDEVKIETLLVQPVLKAGEKQTAYIKVGLTGFQMKQEKRIAANVAIVLDKSGSMDGEKIEKARKAAIIALECLNKNDIVSIVAYDDGAQVIVPATKAREKENIIRQINRIYADGGTALYAGVEKGAVEVRKFFSKNKVNRVILLSDGQANVGPRTPYDLSALGERLVEEGISVTTIGLGLDYNEDLMVKLARSSNGNRYFARAANQLNIIFEREFSDVLSVVAQEVVINIHCADGIRPIRSLNRDPSIDGQNITLYLNQIYSEQEKYLIFEVEIPPTPVNDTRKIAQVDISYANMKTSVTDRQSHFLTARFSKSDEEIKKATHKEAMSDALLQIAVKQNRLAVELRDKGEVSKAKEILQKNAQQLFEYADEYDSSLFGGYADSSSAFAESIDDDGLWEGDRKEMLDQSESLEDNQSSDLFGNSDLAEDDQGDDLFGDDK
ncbi:VWA domain-containing protein [Candidatus Uabimicrobium sp. HlEnr_7]|uniref:vWA domain-containing protein n=1 Tax=Candidatus Uabimicrobium helgolandensis TaxID=3095367 RepID=UPI003556EF10